MKKRIVFCFTCLWCLSFQLSAELDKLSFQAIIRDQNNQLVSNTTIAIQFKIIAESIQGNIVYQETQLISTNINGLLSTTIGGNTNFDQINWANTPFFIQYEIDIEGGTNFTISQVNQLLSVPYALHATTANYALATKQSDDGIKGVSWIGDTLYMRNDYFIVPGISAKNRFKSYPVGATSCAVWGHTEVKEVINPVTGKTWMDRNVGAFSVAKSVNDFDGFGDLYQWGRFSDGHQCRLTGVTVNFTQINQPQHSDYIAVFGEPFSWRVPFNADLWQGVNGVNNPCPTGFRIPTEEEWLAEVNSWSSPNIQGAFSSVLKLPTPGFKSIEGQLTEYLSNNVGYYWTSTVVEENKIKVLALYPNQNGVFHALYSPNGLSVRCIKE